MKRIWTAIAASLLWSLSPAMAENGWSPQERTEYYKISGRSGIELYRSIGRNGPKLGPTRAIAYTDFKLLWSRDYRRQPDNACKLVTSRPSLTITYRLPKAPDDLRPATRKAWEDFAAGIAAHEKVHGEIILDMVRAIEAVSVGLTVPADPQCRKIRTVLQEKLGALSQEQRRRSREFDRLEMNDGGNVHQLVLSLVNGG